MGSNSWYCDNCGAGFKNPWIDPSEASRHLPAGGGPFLFYPPNPNASSCNSSARDEILTTSIRWEMFRNGLEAAERFYRLKMPSASTGFNSNSN